LGRPPRTGLGVHGSVLSGALPPAPAGAPLDGTTHGAPPAPAAGASSELHHRGDPLGEACPHCCGRAERGSAAARAGLRRQPGRGVPMPDRRWGPAAWLPRTWWRWRRRTTEAAHHCGTSTLLLGRLVSQASPARVAREPRADAGSARRPREMGRCGPSTLAAPVPVAVVWSGSRPRAGRYPRVARV